MTRHDTEREEAWMRERMGTTHRVKRGRKPGWRKGDPKEHGTRSCYMAGCKCLDCSRANREYGLCYRATHHPTPRMRTAKRELKDERSLTVDSLELMRANVWLYLTPGLIPLEEWDHWKSDGKPWPNARAWY